ncbi:MAG TPA: uroporphyrinogen-III synthase [Thermoanaerobaculia bacterium]|nr:uroporphyrinogen-III synthase [Thermoanaerobaculia bacterium]
MRNREAEPLAGVRVVVTRAAEQAEELMRALAAAGARAEALPLLEVVPPGDPGPLARAAAELGRYDWVVFTSANAVRAFVPLAGGTLPAGVRVAAVGEATATVLRELGIETQLQTDQTGGRAAAAGSLGAAGLLAALAPLVGGRRVLLPQAADALPTLREGLIAAGARLDTLIAYDKRLPAAAPARASELFSASPLGWVTFTSPRIVRHFADLFGPDWPRRRPELLAASIGAVTSVELRRHAVEPSAEALRPSDRELVTAICAAVLRNTRT